jgi:hypothetical protein
MKKSYPDVVYMELLKSKTVPASLSHEMLQL